MAIAGVHNFSVLDSSFLGGSRSRRSDGGTRSTQASPLLHMWREFEEGHMVSLARERSPSPDQLNRTDVLINDQSPANVSDSNGTECKSPLENAALCPTECETWSESRNGSHDEHEVSSNFSCDNASDFGEVERQRVRQIFREWMTSGVREHSPNVSTVNSSSREEWLAQNEQERVRIIREWVEMNSQRRGASGVNREEQSAEVGSQIGCTSDGPSVDHSDVLIHHTERIRRGIRKLCGRQALLDMLKKAEKERQRELQVLMEQRAVSHFPHRNRIQAQLRGRFLHNGRLTENIRPTSTAESELGFLRQRQTVSGLREGFFSRLDDSGSVQVINNQCDASSNADLDIATIEHTLGGNFLVLNEQLPPPASNNVHNGSLQLLGDEDCLYATRSINSDRAESSLYVDWVQHSVLGCELRDGHSFSARTNYEQGVDEISEVSTFDEPHPNTLQIECDSLDEQSTSTVESVERRDRLDGTSQDAPSSNFRDQLSPATELLERKDKSEEDADETSTGGLSEGEQNNMENSSDISSEPIELENESDAAGGSPNHYSVAESYGSVMMTPESALHEGRRQEEVFENVGNVWQRSTIEYNDWAESSEGHTGENRQNNDASEWSQLMLGNRDGDIPHLQETPPETWNGHHDFQEAVHNWLGRSDSEASSISRVDAFYFPDDDNVYSAELRELLSRRSVSNLLQSGFRESLDQLIQSYVERQSHAHVNWELREDTPSLASAEQDLDLQRRDLGVQPDNAADGPINIPVPPTPPSQPLWDRQSQSRHDIWPRNILNNQRLRIEWGIINDLRIDMAVLQQKMNDMQRMLETCVDMQLELQRSIRQEVSRALNRSDGSPGAREECPVEKSKWEHVRKGVCCICRESNIDSLLYRCGHLCTCSKCANDLMQSRQKCPMCRAPVIEVIRAYSIQ